MFPKDFKTIKIGTKVASNVIKDLDSDVARFLLAADDTRREITGDLITAGIGIGVNLLVDELPPEIMLGAVDGALDMTDFIEAADDTADLLIGGALISAASKFVRNFNALEGVRDMNKEEFASLIEEEPGEAIDLSKMNFETVVPQVIGK